MTVDTNAKEASGLMWHNGIHCSGEEEQLLDCSATLEHQFQKCSSTKYAGIKCEILKGIYTSITNTLQ